MVDREARNKLIETINRFLAREIKSNEYDETMQDISTNDHTVNNIINEAWLFYDDLSNHYADLSQDDWDYHQRLLLILESDGILEETERRCILFRPMPSPLLVLKNDGKIVEMKKLFFSSEQLIAILLLSCVVIGMLTSELWSVPFFILCGIGASLGYSFMLATAAKNDW